MKKKLNNLGKKLKLKESSEKKVGKIGEKKVEKRWKKIYVGTKSYMSVKKGSPGKRLKKVEKSYERSLKKIEMVEKKFGQNLKKCWKNRWEKSWKKIEKKVSC